MIFFNFFIKLERILQIMATINDIAQKLGVSKSTVSKGLNHATDISEEMRKKILEKAE